VNRVGLALVAWIISSVIRFETPITLIGVDDFVGRERYELTDARFGRRADERMRSEDVVPHGSEGLTFEQRHVLERRSVKNNVGAMQRKQLAQEAGIAHISQHWGDAHGRRSCGKRLIDAIETLFVMFEQDQMSNAESAETLTQPRAGTPPCTGHKHRLDCEGRTSGCGHIHEVRNPPGH
jgi:hypothetical protein